MRLILFSLALLVAVIHRAPAQPKEKPKDPPPRALYALQLGADLGKSTKLTIRGVGVDTATEIRLGEPKSSGKVVGKGRKVAVPNQMSPQVVGDSEIDATLRLNAAGLSVGTVTREASDSVPSGRVIRQSPRADTFVGIGAAVDLVVSSGGNGDGGGGGGGAVNLALLASLGLLIAFNVLRGRSG